MKQIKAVGAVQGQPNLVAFGGGNPKLRNDSTTTSATLSLGNVTNFKSAGAASNLRLQGSNQGDNTVSGAISFTPGRVVNLIKEDAGKWILSGGNTYTGTTRVEGGTLVVSGSGSVNTSSSVTIDGAGALLRYEGSLGLSKDLSFGSGGGTLLYNSDAAYSGAAITASANHIVGGSGRLGTLTIASGGQLTPGASGDESTGTLSLSVLTLQAGAETRLDLLSASLYDSVAASGAITLGGVLNLDFGSSLGDGTALTLFSSTSLSGSFSSVNALGAYSGSFSVEDGVFSMASGAQLLRLDQSTGIFSVHTQAIPEPSTIGMLAAAVAGLALLRRRKR